MGNGTVVGRGSLHRRGQSLDLQSLGNFHERSEIGVLDVDHALVHELEQLGHDGVGDIFEDDWVGEKNVLYNCCWVFSS